MREEMHIIGPLRFGSALGLFYVREEDGLFFLTEEGRKNIEPVEGRIEDFIADEENLCYYLSLIKGPANEYEYDKAVISPLLNGNPGKDNRFAQFLNDNSQLLKQIAEKAVKDADCHIPLYIFPSFQVSFYIREAGIERGYMAIRNGLWVPMPWNLGK